jgi:hypothetical protein
VVLSSSLPVIVKPGVDVEKVTVPMDPDDALSVLLKAVLLAVFVEPEVGVP